MLCLSSSTFSASMSGCLTLLLEHALPRLQDHIAYTTRTTQEAGSLSGLSGSPSRTNSPFPSVLPVCCPAPTNLWLTALYFALRSYNYRLAIRC